LAEEIHCLPVMNVTREGVRVKEARIHEYVPHHLKLAAESGKENRTAPENRSGL